MTSQFESVWRSLEEAVVAGHAPGMVAGVRHNGTTEIFATGVLAVGSSEAMTEETPFRIASLSKLLLGVLAASLLSDGVFGSKTRSTTGCPSCRARGY
jgi:CubicO group peptidase (beta-lactamase class C family)